jgi:actin-related protein
VTFSASILLDIAPVCEGAVQHIASKRLEIGGVDLTNLFAQELKKSNPSVNLDVADVELLKEQYACCTEDYLTFESIESSCQPEKHTLPDGQVGYYSFSAVNLVSNIQVGPLLLCVYINAWLLCPCLFSCFWVQIQ